ncbi:cerebellin 20 [Amia ocellicauda]|uniref:cerebellin 20 n=1 Tax=Amia ocellicauda TaxID=2972642 RepID=UPI003464AD0A
MRGPVFLCAVSALLGLSLGENFSWNGPGGNTPTSAAPDNICVTDAASCGCCVMQRQMKHLEQFFNATLNKMQADLDQAQAALSIMRAPRAAFSAALTDTRICLGPDLAEVAVVYRSVFINQGGHYNTSSGVFKAPMRGVYVLAVTAYSDAGSPTNMLAACVNITRNGKPLAALSERNNQDQEDSASVVFALQLEVGDAVAVRLPPGCFLCDDDRHYNTFSIFLLQRTT